jgi:hypothetical protein
MIKKQRENLACATTYDISYIDYFVLSTTLALESTLLYSVCENRVCVLL